ncbi:MAG TPA: ADP-ribosylglycohydrolase family protein, partial [Rectinema sp.]|nr:ADP-ribosylglycohydrolase family protein [Rectinema sp.]
LLHEIHYAPRDLSHPYWRYEHPQEWNEIREAMPAATVSETGRPSLPSDLEARIHAGWLGQLAGGAFGTAIEGYHSEQLHKVYGRIDEYITEPETTNDDVVYELAFLDALEKNGRNMTSCDIALEWIRQIPFGWSAEWIALHNLADGIFPPESGSWHNPYSNWIGAQMRGMVCGLVSPGWPMEAARLAYLDGVVSHAENGVYGEIYAAVLTSLAFNLSNPRTLIINAAEFIPAKSEYAAVLTKCFETVRSCAEPEAAWQELDIYFERYNWIHAYPNIAAVITALWFGNCDMTESFRILAHAGLDVDCNAGLVGTVIGIINGISDKWGKPLNDTLETYLAGKEHLSIQALANTTARLATL